MSNESVFFSTQTEEQSAPPAGGNPTTGGTTPQTSTGKKSSREAVKKFVEDGYKDVIKDLSDEERANLGSKSNTLELKRVLGLGSKKDSRKVGGADGQMVECDKPVALEYLTTIDVEVPVLPVTTNTKSDIDFTNIPTRSVKAGETFQVTYFEAMLLLIRDEYTGTFKANGLDDEGYLTVNLPNYLGGSQKIPTPAFNLRNSAIKEDIFRIDEQKEDGTWTIKEEFAHYADFLKKSRTQRASGGTTQKTSRQEKVSLALQRAFGMR